MTPDLSLVGTADLLDAVFSRYDNAIFHGTLSRPIAKDDLTSIYSIRTSGDAFYAMGLAHAVVHFLNTEQDQTRTQIDPNEL